MKHKLVVEVLFLFLFVAVVLAVLDFDFDFDFVDFVDSVGFADHSVVQQNNDGHAVPKSFYHTDFRFHQNIVLSFDSERFFSPLKGK